MSARRTGASPLRAPAKVGAALVLVLSMAPAAGNIGSCGQPAEELDAFKFFSAKATVDCTRCAECALFTEQCEAACSEPVSVEVSFPDGCLPLVHDGEVCLDALRASSCDDYAGYVADAGATIPTECNFCPLDEGGNPDRGADE